MKLTSALDIDNKKIVYDGCMVTFTGTIVDLMNPRPEDIHLADIGHGLAFNCRWNGATRSYYSIAEHCCRMYDAMPVAKKATALFHDCEEAYWGDVIKPLKNIMPKELRDKMREMRRVIFYKYFIDEICHEVEAEDFRQLQWDLDNLILSDNHFGWDCYTAEKEWMKRAQTIIL